MTVVVLSVPNVTPLEGLERTTLNVSAASATLSSRIVTVMVLAPHSPSAQLSRLPNPMRWKSVKSSATPLALVVKSTLTAPALPSVRLAVTVILPAVSSTE